MGGGYSADRGPFFHYPVYLDPASGTLRFLCYPAQDFSGLLRQWPDDLPAPELLTARIVRRPDGRRFSAKAVNLLTPIHEDGWRVALLVDQEDGTLWSVDTRQVDQPVEQVFLPAGDEFIAVEPLVSERALRSGAQYRTGGAIRGHQGAYGWNGKELLPFAPRSNGSSQEQGELAVSSSPLSSRWDDYWPEGDVQDRGVFVNVVDKDPIATHIEVVDQQTDEVLYSHRYAPSTLGERLSVLVLYASELVGVPVVSVASYLGVDWDPLFLDGLRPVAPGRAAGARRLVRRARPASLPPGGGVDRRHRARRALRPHVRPRGLRRRALPASARRAGRGAAEARRDVPSARRSHDRWRHRVKSLIKKELMELVLPVALLLWLLSMIWAVAVPHEAFLWPRPGSRVSVIAVAGVVGALLGAGMFALERWRQTEDYLVHRAGGARAAFRAKALVGLGAAALLGVGPAVFLWVRTVVGSPLGPIAQPERLFELVAFGAIALPTFAAGAFVVQLRRSRAAGLKILGAATLGALVLPSFPPMLVPSLWPVEMIARDVLFALVVLALAERVTLARLDPELALPPRLFAGSLALGLVLVVFPLVMLASAGRGLVLHSLYKSYPAIVLDGARDQGRWSAVEPEELEAYGQPVRGNVAYLPTRKVLRVADLDHATFDPPQPAAMAGWIPLDATNTLSRPMGRPFEAYGKRFAILARFDPHAGVVHRFAFESTRPGFSRPWPGSAPAPALPSYEVLRKPDGARFSPRTRVYGWADDERVACLVDPVDGSLWSYSSARGAPLQRIELPGGDRFVELDTALDPVLASVDVGQRFGGWSHVRGQQGTYVWTGREFALHEAHLPHIPVAFASEPPAAGRERLVVEGEGTLTPRAEVVDRASGEVLFAHDYAPRGLRAWSTFLSVHGFSLLGAPLVSLVRSVQRPEVEVSAFRIVGRGRGVQGRQAARAARAPPRARRAARLARRGGHEEARRGVLDRGPDRARRGRRRRVRLRPRAHARGAHDAGRPAQPPALAARGAAGAVLGAGLSRYAASTATTVRSNVTACPASGWLASSTIPSGEISTTRMSIGSASSGDSPSPTTCTSTQSPGTISASAGNCERGTVTRPSGLYGP